MNLAELITEALAGNKKLDVIIGDGIDPMREIHNSEKISHKDLHHRNRNRLYQLDKESWGKYETVRHFTTNGAPTSAYHLILHLARKRLLRSVITTNYDCTLDSLFHQFNSHIGQDVVINPILNPGEWDHFGYCSEKNTNDAIELWKIHGSLNYIYCRGCSTILKCPNFVLPYETKDITDRYHHPISHSYLPGKARCCPIPVRPKLVTGSLCSHYVHANDWNLPDFKSSEPFSTIIKLANERILIDSFGIIIIGFKGNRNYESLNNTAAALDGTGVKWVMYLCEDQKEKVEAGPDHFHLRDIVVRNDGDFKYYSVRNLASSLDRAALRSRLISPTEGNDYREKFNEQYIPLKYWERMLSL